MYKSFCFALCASALIAAGSASGAPRTLKMAEEAAESPALDIDLASSTAGRVNAKLCDQCETLTLAIDAGTVVFLHGARVPLQMAEDRKAQGATVFFDRQTMIVKRIVLWE